MKCNTQGCRNVSDEIQFYNTSIPNKESSTLKVYPNPAQNELYVEYTAAEGEANAFEMHVFWM
ncbi:MAG: hypothetical protein R2852_07885 [Bacteroidia bacterium]